VSQTTTGVRAVLSRPAVYELWSRVVGGDRARNTFARDHIRPVPGERVLDLGCATGDILPYLGDVDYVGVDLSPEYVARGRERFGDGAEFRAGDATAIDDDLRDFDVVLALGVLHHLDDDGARGLFRGAARALRPGGRVITLDNAFTDDQSRVARAIIARDRGQHVREPAEYAALASEEFADVQQQVRHDLMHIPYTHVILECRAPLSAPVSAEPIK
jgi:SAM-dependent methyltransferase